MVDRVKVGLFLASARKQSGLTQADLAERLEVSNKTVSRWETGQTMPDYSQVLNICRLLNISVYDFLAGEYGAEARYMPMPREGSIQIPSESTPAAKPEQVRTDEPTQATHKKGFGTRFTEITLLVITGVLSVAVLLLGGVVIRNMIRPASTVPPTEPEETPFETPYIGETPTPEPTAEPQPSPVAQDDEIAALEEQYPTRTYGDGSVTILPAGTVPQSLAGRKMSDEELLALKSASPQEIRAAVSTVEDMIAWFTVIEPEMSDSDPVHIGTFYAYATPEEKLLESPLGFATDSISITAAWLLQDDYAGCGVLGACDVSCRIMNPLCVCIPIDGGWYVFNMAACTEKGSFENMLDAVAVRDLRDLHPYLDDYSLLNGVRLNEIVLFEDLSQPIMFEESGGEKHWMTSNATIIPER